MENLSFPPMPSPDSESALNTDWEYEMRRQMQEILPGLYLGPYAAARKTKLDYLKQHQITHIVCIRQAVEANFIRPNFPDCFRYLVLDIMDCTTENIIQHFPKVKEFLEDCFSQGGKALVHGNAGISRSAALVIAYIMEKFGLPYKEAFKYVQQKRFCISLNPGFEQQLQEYEPIYRAKLIFQNGQPSKDRELVKRKHEDDMMDYENGSKNGTGHYNAEFS